MKTRSQGAADQDPETMSNPAAAEAAAAAAAEKACAAVLKDLQELKGEINTLTNKLADVELKPATPSIDRGFSAYLPSPFTGDPTENINQFVEKFNIYTDFMGFDAKKKCSLIPMLLTGRALSWFRAQPAVDNQDPPQPIVRTWADTETLLQEKYGPSAIGYLQQSILLDKQQGAGETVKKYADEVYARLSLTGIQDPEAWKIFVKGLRPEIKFQVLQKQPDTLDQAQKFAFEAEQLATLQQPALLDTCAKMLKAMQPSSSTPAQTASAASPTASTSISAIETKVDQLARRLEGLATRAIPVQPAAAAASPAPAAAATPAQPASQLELLVTSLANIVMKQGQPQQQNQGQQRGRGQGRGRTGDGNRSSSQGQGQGRYNDSDRTSSGRPICANCNRVGHYTNRCSTRTQTPTRRGNCYICQSTDHWADRCPQRSSQRGSQQYGNGSQQGNA